jgi:hypothetical protein
MTSELWLSQRNLGLSSLVLDGHRLGIYGLFSGDSFETGEDATIVVLVALHGESAFHIAGGPGQANKMLF